MTEWIRVRDKETGHHLSIDRARYDAAPDLWVELKQPATSVDGDPLPPKYKTTVSTETGKGGQSAETVKEK